MQNETSFSLYLKALGFFPKPTFFEPDAASYEGLDVVASGLRYEDPDLDPNRERFRLDRIYFLHTNTCHIEVLDNIIRDMLHFLEDSVKFIDTGGETYRTKVVSGTGVDPAYIVVREPNPYVDKLTACVYDKTFAYARFQSTCRQSFLQYGISQAGGLKTLDPLSKEFVQAMRAELKTVIQKLKGIRENHLTLRGIDTVEEGDMYILRYPEIVTISPLWTTRSLYPPKQVEVMNQLVELSKKDVNVVIVSNSDYALLGLRIAVEEKRLSCKDLIIDFFTDDVETISYIDIPLDPNGTLKFWPEGLDYFTEYLLKLA